MATSETTNYIPSRIVVHRRSRVLELEYEQGRSVRLPFEFLRVFSPSAEVRGHGPGQEVLQVGKADVEIEELEAIGQYAIQPRFSDGHQTGIYSWDYLWRLGQNQDKMWQDYLKRLEDAGESRHAGPAKPGGAVKPGGAAGKPGGAGPGGAGQAGAAAGGLPGARAVTRPR